MKFFLLMLLLFSCGEDYHSHRKPILQEEVSSLNIESFSTRLTNNLLISGKRCVGTEVETRHNETFFCQEGEYLVTVDTTNFCTPDGCTNVSVEPVVATVTSFGGDSVSDFFVFRTSESGEVSTILDTVFLRIRDGEAPKVVYR